MNTAIGLTCMYIGLDLFHLSYWTSTFFGNAIGAVVSYLLNRTFTFKSETHVGKSSIRFILVILICYFVSYKVGITCTTVCLEHWPIFPKSLNKEVAILLGSSLYTLTNYFGQRYFVFNTPQKKVMN